MLKTINQVYINGAFVTPHGTEVLKLLNPTTKKAIVQVQLADEEDTRRAIASAKLALRTFSQTTTAERLDYLQRLHDALMPRVADLQEATLLEYGAPVQRALWSNKLAAETFLYFKKTLADFTFEKPIGTSALRLEPVGVAAILTAWNSSAGSVCVKLGAAIAAGCTAVIKPSELSPWQTQIMTEAFHAAGLPAGVINVITGRGSVVGAEISRSSDVALIAFTGSTQVGKQIGRDAVETMKRVKLELSGKSPNIILEDADFAKAIPLAVNACFQNNGQACIAGSRLLVPAKRLGEVKELLKAAVEQQVVGDPRHPATTLGPLANQQQYDRVQHYIRLGQEEGAELLLGGEGHPEGLETGYFVRPTVFTGVKNDMHIAQEEIFGPVLSVITYESEDEAIAIANDTVYGLVAYVSSTDEAHAHRVANQLAAGRVLINTINHDPIAPFGGFKQSGIGREGGEYGLEEYLEAKAILG